MAKRRPILNHGPTRKLVYEMTGGIDLVEEARSGNYSAGQLALMGQAMSEVADIFKGEAREAAQTMMEGGREARDWGVRFELREPHVQRRVDTRTVKEMMPFETWPVMYKEVKVASSVAISMPEVE